MDTQISPMTIRTRAVLAVFASALACCVFGGETLARADALQDIRAAGELVWGADAEGGAPYVFADAEHPDALIGFEVDLAQAIAVELGVRARLFQTDWTSLLPALKRGDFHIALNGIEWTPERARETPFSDPYYIYAQQLVVRSGDTTVESLAQLRGKPVGTLAGSAAETLLRAVPGMRVSVYSGQVEPYRDLALGRLDGVLLDTPIAAWYARSNPQLRFAGPPLGRGMYAIALRAGDTALREEINRILDRLFRSGKLKSIYERWGLWNAAQQGLQDKTRRHPAATETANNGFSIYWPILLKGAGMTVAISTVAMALAIVLGLSLCLLRLCGGNVFKSLAVAYVEIIRGTPLLLQLYIIYYGLPNIGINLNAFTAAVLALGMHGAAYEAEIYRAGIASIPKGQTEAALSLGMTQALIYRRILIPQAVRLVLPPVTNDFIALFKDSSLVSVIALVELTKTYNMLAVASMRYLELGLLTAALYLVMSLPLSYLSHRLEWKLRAP
jgi:polar amino acid transport system substrate-binding protein